ncbi:MAG: hypothetical protein OXG95_08510, partial [Chloroflexi bacterium]|nr:hypothetical protein [Chloroflexota bacterium]
LTVTGTAIVISDDDDPPSGITLTASPDSVAEDGGATTITVTASTGATTYADAKTLTIVVGKAGDSAVEGTDYVTVSDQTITIAAGTTSGSVQFTLTPSDDSLVEGDETISVTGSMTGDGAVTGDTIAITDVGSDKAKDGTVYVTVHTYDTYILERGFAHVRIRVSDPLASAVTIPLLVTPLTAEPDDVKPRADNPAKYDGPHASPAWGRAYADPLQVTIAKDQEWWSIDVDARQDADRDNETFKVALDIANLPDEVVAGEQTEVLISVADEARAGAAKRWWSTLTTEARRSWLKSILPVNDRTLMKPGLITYDALGDYARARVTFAAGELIESINGNHATEQEWWNSIDCSTRLMALGLHETDGMEATWCKDWPDSFNDPAMLAEEASEQVVDVCKALLGTRLGGYASAFSVSDATAVAGTDDELVFTVSLRNPTVTGGRVAYHTRDLSAQAGIHYTAVSGTLTFGAGETEKTVRAPVLVDEMENPRETLELVLSLPAGGVIRDGIGSGYIVQQAPGPEPRLRPRAAEAVVSVEGGWDIAEGSGAHFVFKATPVPPTRLQVRYTLSQEGDFGVTSRSGWVTLATDGEAHLSIGTSDDDVVEPDGYVVMTIDPDSSYAIDPSAVTARTLVMDDDDPPPPATTRVQKQILQHISFHEHFNNPIQLGLWQRALAAVRGEDPPSGWPDMTASEAQTLADGHVAGGRQGHADLWNDIAKAIEAQSAIGLDAVRTGQPGVTPPEARIAAVSAVVTEGASAVFTITVSPAPTADLVVSVTVSEQGDYATAGTRMVTVPTTGTTTLTIATTGDSTDEPAGSVTATIAAGAGYTGSGSATVTIRDDDGPPPSCTAIPTADDLVDLVRSYHDANKTRADYNQNWLRVLIAFGEKGSDTLRPYTVAEAKAGEQIWDGWKPVRAELERLEQAAVDCPSTLAVSIAAGSAVTEGSAATFTLTASPKPSSSISIKVDITQSGDYAASTAQRTVTIGKSGTATLSIPTTGDSKDEPDGSVTATIAAGSGYTGSGSATVTVKDDDPPVVTLAVSIAAGSAVTEGSAATFTLTASPKPSSSISIKVDITQSGDYAASTAQRTVTIGTSGTVTLSIPTTGDSTDEPDGSVTATIAPGTGYTGSGSATVTVRDDDDPPPSCTVTPTADDLVDQVRSYHDANKSRADYNHNWFRVLIAFGEETSGTLTPFTVAEAKAGEQIWDGWTPVRVELERLEQAATDCASR